MQGMDVRGKLPMRRIVNTFGAIGYTLLWFSYVIVLGVGVMWLAQGGHLEIIGVSPVKNLYKSLRAISYNRRSHGKLSPIASL